MESIKHISRLAGTLILIGMIAGVFSIVPSVESEDYLREVFPNRSQALIGAALQFMLVPTYIGFALVLFSVLKKQNEPSAIGFVGFRLIAGVFQIFGVILLPLFIYISRIYLTSVGENLIYLESIGEMLRVLRDLTNHLGVMVATGIGNLLLYYIFLSGKFIPKWLSIWGIMGNVLLILASFLLLFQLIEVISISYIAMTIPVVLQELSLAIWLIIIGLNLKYLSEQKDKKTNAQQCI